MIRLRWVSRYWAISLGFMKLGVLGLQMNMWSETMNLLREQRIVPGLYGRTIYSKLWVLQGQITFLLISIGPFLMDYVDWKGLRAWEGELHSHIHWDRQTRVVSDWPCLYTTHRNQVVMNLQQTQWHLWFLPFIPGFDVLHDRLPWVFFFPHCLIHKYLWLCFLTIMRFFFF